MSHWPYCLQVIPINSGGTPIGDVPFTRTGLLGFVGPVSNSIVDFVAFLKHLCLYTVYRLPFWPFGASYITCRTKPICRTFFIEKNSSLCPQGSLVFVVGKIDGLLSVSGRRHNADDLVATALAVEPVRTVYRGRYEWRETHSDYRWKCVD